MHEWLGIISEWKKNKDGQISKARTGELWKSLEVYRIKQVEKKLWFLMVLYNPGGFWRFCIILDYEVEFYEVATSTNVWVCYTPIWGLEMGWEAVDLW